jgi:cyclic beta-1,2-glucan synthetase
MLYRKSKIQFNNITNEEPIREEIFSSDRLNEYAIYLSKELQTNINTTKCHSFLKRIKENERFLQESYNKITNYFAKGIPLSPGAEWIIDNFHIIQEQIREINEDLPKEFYLELPKIKENELAGYPRVYAIALILIAHQDSYIDIDIIKNFIKNYQKNAPLLIGEIWAIPIMLRIGLIENLRRLAIQIVISQEAKNKVKNFTDDNIKSTYSNSGIYEKFVEYLERNLGESQITDLSVISQLSQSLHVRTSDKISIYDRIKDYLNKNDYNIEEYITNEHQLQTLTQVSVSNIISSMKRLSNTDWQVFFEDLSLVDKELQKDPADIYARMDFKSRDDYRKNIEIMHKKTKFGEIKIACEATRMSRLSKENNDKDISKYHVGYYLIGEGQDELKRKINYNCSIKDRLKIFLQTFPFLYYSVSLIFLTLVLILPVSLYIYRITSSEMWTMFLVILALIPASDSALNILNLLTTFILKPKLLPKIDLKDGVPNNAKTFVIVPMIFSNESEVYKALEDLEIRYLGNRDQNIYFALLSDLKDSNNKEHPDDHKITNALDEGIKRLNEKYEMNSERFFLFNRKRKWNTQESIWMGWERKRGKIHEFNCFLRQCETTSFNIFPEYKSIFKEIKYVITLDADTKLPRNIANRLIGTILHPLNTSYSILQPRIGITPESSEKSLFAKVYSGHTGIDPYTSAVSDTYQDLFGEGIFTGKGLYVLDSFEKSLKGKMPENTLLSHDLIEGLYAKTALVSDIELLDDYPTSYECYAKRNHRWIRGDWQIVTWIFQRVKNEKGKIVKNTLSPLSRWKILDNLRRSLVVPTTFIWLILSWTLIPGNLSLWTLIIISIITLPIYAQSAGQVLQYPKNLSWWAHLLGLYQDFKMNMAQLGISIMTLPFQTLLHLDAIFVTLYRIFISKKNLLQWTTAAQIEQKKKSNFLYKLFFYSLFVCTFLTISLSYLDIKYYYITVPFILLWVLSPYFLNIISKSNIENSKEIGHEDREIFRNIACRTWNFFETFVTNESNWLPPDNFQQEPEDLVAFRTSPTNIGLYLLSCCSAYNFGYISIEDLVERLENTLSSISKLPTKFGHLYNWYDIRNLEAMNPLYISTVDSGNLAGHLIAVKQSCIEISNDTMSISLKLKGIIDLLNIIAEETTMIKEIRNKIQNTIEFIKEHDQSIENLNPLFEKILSDVSLLKVKIEQSSIQNTNKKFTHVHILIEQLCKKIQISILEESKIQEITYRNNIKERLLKISNDCNRLVYNMDFSILYDKKRKLFSIGQNILDGKNDDSYYDLLASEARLTSLISIAKGEIPEEHWFHLGRQMTSVYHSRALISWSASMFEYLMPLLVTKDYHGTLLHETYRSIVSQQIAYGKIKKRPWGLSESAYNIRDQNMNYQYGPFGVPGVGLKRGLSQDYVLSPYSSILSSMVNPDESIKNIKKLINHNFLTKYGFYEAIDYTESRLLPNQPYAIVKNFMAHHQGMTLIALDNILNSNIVCKRFHNDPIIKTSELLLQERVPQRVSIIHPRKDEVLIVNNGKNKKYSAVQCIGNVHTKSPITRIISNGSYTVMVTATGSGFSNCNGKSVLRWNEDVTLENQGNYFFINDSSNESLKSLTFSPLNKFPQNYKTTFSNHKAEFWYENKNLSSHIEVIVSTEDNVELRRITITNLNPKTIDFDFISYSEPVLSDHNADISHPSFNKLFIETEYIEVKNALLAKRRRKDKEDEVVYGINKIVFDKKKCKSLSYETDREKFLGRNNSWKEANGLKSQTPHTNTVGGVLDPIFSFKTNVKLRDYESTTILIITGITNNRNEALRLIDQYDDFKVFDREEKMSWTKCQIELRHLDLELDEVNTFQKLASALIFSNAQTRPAKKIIEDYIKPQSELWGYSISGDLPILVVLIKDLVNINIVQDLLQFHEYLRKKCIYFDLVFITEESSLYRITIHAEVYRQIRIFGSNKLLNKKGGISVLQKALIPESDFYLFMSVARIYFSSLQGNLKNQVNQLLKTRFEIGLNAYNSHSQVYQSKKQLKKNKLEYFNGYGGFHKNGHEYQIILENKEKTPAPWINVIANSKDFGFIISESGSGYTWSKNSSENKITPWSNDSVLDSSGEILYIKDNNNNSFWSPTANPIQSDFTYIVTHGQGFSSFEYTCSDIYQKLTLYVSLKKEVKYYRLTLKNLSHNHRDISVFLYIELVLGLHKSKTTQHIITEQRNGILCAKNKFSTDFFNRITYLASNKETASFTCDRSNFLGRFRDYINPKGVMEDKLNMEVGAGLDPCMALRVDIKLMPNEEKEVVFILGQEDETSFNPSSIKDNLKKSSANNSLQEIKEFWDKKLNKVQIKTNYRNLDILINNWLLYQTLSCRIWARTAFYQAGGAFGFRDQLQDITSLLHTAPEIARAHIIKSASHQFPEGDVLHWWHPPYDKGVRTHFSDDLLWLPYAVNLYIEATGDISILDEKISFIQGPKLRDDQDDIYIQATPSNEKVTLYDHCVLALDSRLDQGQNGLPFIGSGDWNDGMNKVGNEGSGESIWMGWFLGHNLLTFKKYCSLRGDSFRDLKYQEHISKLKEALETKGWDGKWYRRAYFDNGAPLGSETNDECKIDSISQSWSLLSNIGDRKHQQDAMHFAKKYLINDKNKLVHLFQPAFNKTNMEPGYIKGYLPGIRENGGQYTHAAIWFAMALAKNNDADTAIKVMNYINPIKLSLDKKKANIYKIEPYVIAADVYSNPLHIGKGGWSWYTGSSCWYYRGVLESLLGIFLKNKNLFIRPTFPEGLKDYEIKYIFGKSNYILRVKESHETNLYIDGHFIGNEIIIPLVDDNKSHIVEVFTPRFKE